MRNQMIVKRKRSHSAETSIVRPTESIRAVARGRLGPLLLGIAAIWLATSTNLFAQEPSWLTDYEKAKERALAENKLILADFWASWCGPCIAMDRRTWNKYTVIAASEKFVCVRLNFDNESSLDRSYDVTAIPAMLILDGFGNRLYHIEGFKSESEMLQIMQPFHSDMRAVYDVIKQSKAAPDSIELRIAIGDQYQLLLMPQASNGFYEELAKRQAVKKNPKLANRLKSRMGLNYHLLGDQGKAKDLLEDCIKDDPQSEDRPMQLFLLTKIHMLNKEEDNARKYLEMLRKEFPDNQHLKWAEALFTK